MDVTGGPLETSGALVKWAIDADVSEFPAVKAGLMVSGMVTGQGDVMVTAGPPDVGMFQGGLFLFSQGGRRGGGGGVLRSGGSFFDEVLGRG